MIGLFGSVLTETIMTRPRPGCGNNDASLASLRPHDLASEGSPTGYLHLLTDCCPRDREKVHPSIKAHMEDADQKRPRRCRLGL